MAEMGPLRGVAFVGARHEPVVGAPFEPVGPAERRAAPSLPPGRAQCRRPVPRHWLARDGGAATGTVGAPPRGKARPFAPVTGPRCRAAVAPERGRGADAVATEARA